MKQNPSILFHFMAKRLRKRYLSSLAAIFVPLLASLAPAAEKPEYLASFDPAKGFRPAQRDLTEIYLQIGGSLEVYGSPIPYWQHVMAEQKRIEGLVEQKTGHRPSSLCPDFMTAAYVEGVAKNWNLLSPQLNLDRYAKEVGNVMRDAILGTRGTGTILVGIFNTHQSNVFSSMTGKSANGADFEALRSELVSRLELNKESVDEARYEIARRDAVSFALGIQGRTKNLFARVDNGLKPDAATTVKKVLFGFIIDTGIFADTELRAGIVERSVEDPSTGAR